MDQQRMVLVRFQAMRFILAAAWWGCAVCGVDMPQNGACSQHVLQLHLQVQEPLALLRSAGVKQHSSCALVISNSVFSCAPFRSYVPGLPILLAYIVIFEVRLRQSVVGSDADRTHGLQG